MANIEKIQGNALLPLFKELKADNSPLKMRLTHEDDTRLTNVFDIRKRKRVLHFLVQSPADYQELSEKANPSRLRFEFIDKENIKYTFRSDAWEFIDGNIWCRFPEVVHRYQRRKLFRLEAPHGTRLFFNINDIRIKLLVINLSLGGTLGVLVSLTPQIERELKRKQSKILKDVELLFPSRDHEEAGSLVNIKRSQIIRQKKNPVTKKYECAIEFKLIEEQEQKKLTDLFYQCQRDYLQKRKIMQT